RFGGWWDGGNDHGSELREWGDGDIWRDGGHQRGGGERDTDYGNDAGTCGGGGDSNCNELGHTERQPEQRIYLHVGNGTNGEQRDAEQRSCGGWHSGDHRGDEFRQRSNGDVWRDGSYRRGGSKRHADHSHHAGACGGCGYSHSDKPGYAERELGERVHL